jgi:hypothetical protein
MNKYNFERAGFEVNRGGYRAYPACGCDPHAHPHGIKGSYGETLNRRAGEAMNSPCGKEKNVGYGVTDRPVGSVYAPIQPFSGLYDLPRALSRGTLFEALDLPLEVGKGGRCNG